MKHFINFGADRPLLILLLLAVSTPAAAEWSSRKTSNFTVLYLPQSSRLVESIIPGLEPELLRVSKLLDTDSPTGITVVLAPDARSFRELQGGGVPPWVSGMAYPGQKKIFLRPLSGAEIRHSSLESVIAHELTHIVLHHKLNGHTPPLWLNEGLAVFMGKEPLYARAERLVPIALFGRNIPFRRLQDNFPDSAHASATAYAQSGDFINFLYREYGSDAILHYLELMANGQDPDTALQTAFDSTLYDLEAMWLKKVKRTYGIIPALSGGSLLWFLISLLAIAAYFKVKLRARQRREEEAAIYGDHRTQMSGRQESDGEDRNFIRLVGSDFREPPDDNTTLH